MSISHFLPAYPTIDTITPYKTGKPISELSRELGLDDVVKLASNENPLGCSPKVLAALNLAIQGVARYPDGSGYHLKHAIVAHHSTQKPNLSTAQVTLGNGSNDILELIARTFVSSQDTVVFSQYAFAVYALATKAVGAQARVVPAQNYAHDLPAMVQAVKPDTKVVFLANPNNPTGTYFTHEALYAFLQAVPSSTLVVLDEAYVEYFEPDERSSTQLLDEFANLVISRTFSKAYGLAGLRVGYALSSEHVADYLNRLRQPFNVNSLAQTAAIAALEDQDFVTQSRELNTQQMRVLEQAFTELGMDYISSKANFIAVKAGDLDHAGSALYEALLTQGVITRPLGGYGMGQWLRVSVGLAQENKRLLECLALMAKAPI